MDASPRFIAFDVHKQYVLAAGINASQQIVLPPRKIAVERFAEWIQSALQPTDQVVLEATTNAWEFCDLLTPLVQEVKVAHPLLVTLISSARVKTDTRDALHLARLLLAGLIPEVWIPPKPVRDLRSLIAHRQRLVRQRTQARNRLQSVLHAHNLVPPAEKPYASTYQTWWDDLPLPLLEKLRVRQDLGIMREMDRFLGEVDDELARLSLSEPWAHLMPYLLQLPGFAIVNSMTLVAAIGDIRRFPSAQKLVGYSGLGASVHASGKTYETGRITKQGRREMRSALIEAAWMAVRYHPEWKIRFERLAARIGKGKAIVAIARKLLVVIWHVLTKEVVDRNAIPATVARKFVRWAKTAGKTSRQGQTVTATARGLLAQLALVPASGEVAMGGKTYKLGAPSVNTA